MPGLRASASAWPASLPCKVRTRATLLRTPVAAFGFLAFLCLLLTLLVTPVAYSYFAELAAKHPLQHLHAGFARVRVGVARVFTL